MAKSICSYALEAEEVVDTDFDFPLDDDADEIALESYYEQLEEQSNLTRSLESIESLLSLQELILAKETVSTEDLSIFKEAVNIALAGSGVESRMVFPSLESEADPRIAIEGIGSKLVEGIQNIGQRLAYGFRNLKDTTKQFLTILDFQEKRVRELRNKLNAARGNVGKGKIKITVPVSVYLEYGYPAKIVTNEKEYLDELNKSCNFINGYLDVFGKLISSNFLTSIKVLLSPITGYNEQYKKVYTRIRDMIIGVSKLPGVSKQSSSAKDKLTFSSERLLGGYQVYCACPNEENFDYTNAPKLKSLTKFFSLDFERAEKVAKGNKTVKSVEMEIDVVQIERLLAEAEQLIESYRKYNSILNKLAMLESGYVLYNTKTILSDKYDLVYLLLSNYRILLKVSGIIIRSSGSAFTIAKGHTKKMLAIAEKTIDTLEA